jgi:hypothetical protein
MEILKQIVNEVFMVDISSESRKTNYVDGRRVYATLMRELGFGYEYIGKTIDRDHSTIIHYVKTTSYLMEYDVMFKRMYNACKKRYLTKDVDVQIKSDNEIHLALIELEERLEKAIQNKNERLLQFIEHLEKYEKKNGYPPDVSYCKNKILSLFDS